MHSSKIGALTTGLLKGIIEIYGAVGCPVGVFMFPQFIVMYQHPKDDVAFVRQRLSKRPVVSLYDKSTCHQYFGDTISNRKVYAHNLEVTVRVETEDRSK